MSNAERLTAGYMTPAAFPHGTPDGFEQGCRAGTCPGEQLGQTCVQASIRYRGDFQYRRAVNDGAPVEVLRLPEVFEKPAKPKPVKVNAPKVQEAPAARRGPGRPPGSTEWNHGTLYGYNMKNCRAGSDCPGGADGRTCAQVKSEKSKAAHARHNDRKREARAAAAEKSGKRQPRQRPGVTRAAHGRFSGREMQRAEHGTMLMYKHGCHTGDPCPAGEFGPTCAEVMAAFNREYQRKNGARIRAKRKGAGS